MSYQQYGSSSYTGQQYGYYPDEQQYYTEQRTPPSRSQQYYDYTPSSAPRTIRPTTTGYPSPPSSPYTSTSNPYYYYSSSPSSAYSTSPTSPGPSHSQPSQPRPQPPVEYHCLICTHTCARKADLERHYSAMHCRDSSALVDCQWAGCHRVGQAGFGRKDKMVEHMRDVHKADIPKRGGGTGGRRS
ncbi:hypothetical protein CLAFUW4_04712 [Fulvia fulva]|uniref:C2H2-type domain-containing protein n=1 Tax=Passalora fulva TaxID=5499 RepID=A0A9Q8LGP6_PASFU|nr:uncharacterized protein CLAFUR5_04672 [Fulvia fulva]KAK4626349.1 hypothetical protein CLAFUR4_04698 [Fulvia fulva]KAK4627466.1 hypothetical protein CLAFUR0_04702 [Fulvia fulva]UJO17081.1 hypothetical protein CLAFUR5_04672 [Fulvia fulva]WPV13197.1 hypothetical protein CLAFUW4_04712 [Fulvia fulva]WPV28840.1 hypothetical protein CLAFUW7_04706 [Fulvia fulva]